MECFGREASAYAKRRLAGRVVRVERGLQERDRYGRLLAYLYLGERMFNADLVRDGYASPMTIAPNVEHADRFVALAREARRRGAGLWGRCANDGAAAPHSVHGTVGRRLRPAAAAV